MRLAYVCADPGVPVFGHKGCSVHVQEVVRALVRRGVDVDLLAARVGGEAPAGLDGVRVFPLPPVADAADLAGRERAALAANLALRAALDGLDAVDAVYERYSLWSFAGMEFARDRGVPGVLEVNSPLVREQERYRGIADRRAAEAVEERAFTAASALVCVSDELASWLRRRSPAAAGRVHVIPNAVDPDRFRPGVTPSLPAREAGAFTVGFVGTMRPWHGVEVLVEAFARLAGRVPDCRLLLVGDGPARAAAEEVLARRGLGAAAAFTGPVSPAQVPGLLASIDVAVAPYPALDDFYFSPLKLYEYMAAGLPVVASRLGSVARVVEDGRTGLLCPPGDPAALAEMLAGLALDPGRRSRLGAAAREAVVRGNSWAAVVGRIIALAGDVAGGGTSSPTEVAAAR